tara:strand:- start:597 stop:1343 length:747 start_codon:yes stop_codon:yes gene_type:complete
MINEVIRIAKLAGKEIFRIYNNNDHAVKIKKDNSPVTKADLIADEIIKRELRKLSDYPILTEESPMEFDTRKKWSKFWIVDPLDGTVDFIEKNGDFTVNIALVEHNRPILGVVFIPVSDIVYHAEIRKGAFKNNVEIYNSSERHDLIGADSNFHSTEETKKFFSKFNVKIVKKYGSSIKICKLAEGEIDVYPRFNGTKEWDTAASHIIANEAGCKLLDISSNEELIYNKKSLINNYFIASRNDLDFEL